MCVRVYRLATTNRQPYGKRSRRRYLQEDKKGAELKKKGERERETGVAEKRRHFANLLADLATLPSEFSVHVGACGQLRERRLLGLLEAEGEHENGEDQDDTHRNRVYVLRVLQQQADVVHGRCPDVRCNGQDLSYSRRTGDEIADVHSNDNIMTTTTMTDTWM